MLLLPYFFLELNLSVGKESQSSYIRFYEMFLVPGMILSSLYQMISGNDSAAAAHESLVGADDRGMG